ncbi:MAG: DNA-3-methyladenine glycosylase I [bacterium]|nr:DNA-3-methyladenine glycosylase I [bacterium]
MSTENSGLLQDASKVQRCWWCGDDPLYVSYHDEEWGRPVHDDTLLFEKLCLEGFQAGLSWITILRKREAFREGFDNFQVSQVASFSDQDVERLVVNAAIVRHRGKIESTINNARRALELLDQYGSLADYFWGFRPERQQVVESRSQVIAVSPESKALSKDLKRRGWSFVGPTTCYAFMQAMGMVNDHILGCHVWREVADEQTASRQSG